MHRPEQRTNSLLCLAAALLALAVGGCRKEVNSREVATALLFEAAQSPVTDVLVWIADAKDRLSTGWVRGNQMVYQLLAVRPGAVLHWGGTLWEWREDLDVVEVPLCDCTAWSLSGYSEDCPLLEEPGRASGVKLVDLADDTTWLEIVAAPTLDQSDRQVLGDYRAAAFPLAWIGPYLFLGYREDSLSCGAAHNSWTSDFIAYDISAGRPSDDWRHTHQGDSGWLNTADKEKAYALLRSNPRINPQSIKDLEPTALLVELDQLGNLRLAYQFTTYASFADSDDSWSSYTRSLRVPASSLPGSLLPYATAPAVIMPLCGQTNEISLRGWGIIDRPQQEIPALFSLFLGN